MWRAANFETKIQLSCVVNILNIDDSFPVLPVWSGPETPADFATGVGASLQRDIEQWPSQRQKEQYGESNLAKKGDGHYRGAFVDFIENEGVLQMLLCSAAEAQDRTTTKRRGRAGKSNLPMLDYKIENIREWVEENVITGEVMAQLGEKLVEMVILAAEDDSCIHYRSARSWFGEKRSDTASYTQGVPQSETTGATRAPTTGAKRGAQWTTDEIALMHQHYGTMPLKQLKRTYFPGRTEPSINAKAFLLGVMGKREAKHAPGRYKVASAWTDDRVQQLRDEWDSRDVADFAREFRLAKGVISSKAAELGLPSKSHAWTEEQEGFLRSHWEDLVPQAIADHLGVKVQDIRTKANDLRLSEKRGWNQPDLSFLRDNYKTMTDEAIGDIIGRSTLAVTAQRTALGLDALKKYGWRPEENEYIRVNYRKMTDKAMAAELNRSRDAVQQQRMILGFAKNKTQKQKQDD
ncbi:hypothetical protein PRZ48_014550 [Zasmidium cellare]|uniref:Uncharacterized protein n=1 Tax=Zasmidium cellare TaxID=395010 RepID=A0ABR0DYN4_ZASCE|nr:hypothetical protein PRZ48_014550 [Zasmidium cellare]